MAIGHHQLLLTSGNPDRGLPLVDCGRNRLEVLQQNDQSRGQHRADQ